MPIYNQLGGLLGNPEFLQSLRMRQKKQHNNTMMNDVFDSILPVYNNVYNYLYPNAQQELQYGAPGFVPNPNSTDPIPLPSWLSNEQIENMATSLLTASLGGMNQVDQVAMMANAQGESNFLPNRTRGGEDSVGLYQLNREGGLGQRPDGTPFPLEALENPVFNTRRIMEEYTRSIGNQTNVDDAIRRMVYYVERPYDKEGDTIKRQGFARGYDYAGVVPTFGPTINVTAPRVTTPETPSTPQVAHTTYIPQRANTQSGPRLSNIDEVVRNNPNVSSASEEKK